MLLLASALVSILTKEYEDAISIALVSARDGACGQHLAPRPAVKGPTESLLLLV